MSSIFSDLVTDILLSRMAAAADSEKHLIRGVLGVSGAEIYAAVIGETNGECSVQMSPSGDNKWTMRCIELDNKVVVIPYLVVQDPTADHSHDPNRGNRGFNGKLRDWFDRNIADGEVRVLLTFDENPIETAKTAMDQGLEASLTASTLLDFAAERVRETAVKAVAPLITETVRFAEERADLSATDVTRTVHALRDIAGATNTEAAGNALVQLPWLLRDPDIEATTARQRLKRAVQHREKLDRAVRDPAADFEQLVRDRYKDSIWEKLLTSRRLNRIDWTQFTLRELEEALREPKPGQRPDPNELDPSCPITVDSANVQVFKFVSEDASGGSNYGIAALVKPGNVSITIRLVRELEDRETLHVITYRMRNSVFVRNTATRIHASQASGRREVTVNVSASPLNSGWFFFEVVLTEATTFVRRHLGRAGIALLLEGEAQELAYEASCRIDASNQCFVAADQADVEVCNSTGATRALPRELVATTGEAGSEFDSLQVLLAGITVNLPIRYELDEEEEPEALPEESSIEHAVLRFAASEKTPIGQISTSAFVFKHDGAIVTVGGREKKIGGVPQLRASRWALESAILRLPQHTNYEVDANGTVVPDERLEKLEMGATTTEPFQAFLQAREAFFRRVRSDLSEATWQTILSVKLAEMPEADDYVATYIALLESIPDSINWQTEYEQILLIDSVSVYGHEGLLIAPTSPLTVAAHQQLQRAMHAHAEDPSTNLFPSDLDILSPRYALPLIRIADRWYESERTGYPWRSYQPRRDKVETYTEPFLPAVIARRIWEFLEVHPLYCDSRRVLTLAFINPGDAKHVLAALQRTVDRAAKSRKSEAALDKLPQFEVKLYGIGDPDDPADAILGAELDSFMTNTQELAPTWTQLELMRRLTYTKGKIAEFIYDASSSPDASSFAHIAFIQDYFRPANLETYDFREQSSTAYADGVAFDLERTAEIQANDISFSSGVWLGQQSCDDALRRLVGRSLEVAAAAGGAPVTANRALGMVTRVAKQLIPLIYSRAVWVVHIDRHIGLELFYPQNDPAAEAPYILDHTDQENLQASGFDAITATTMVQPYITRIEAIFGRHVAAVNKTRTELMLRWLNLLSGRWALRLLREEPTDVKERLAAVVAYRMLAERENLFAEPEVSLSLVVTLDELLRVTGKEGLKTSEGLAAASGHRGVASDDLLLLRIALDWLERPTVFARVIEVKYSEGAAPKDKAWSQVNGTQQALNEIFSPIGPGRPFRGRMLSKLIRSYVSRLAAFGLLDRGLDNTSQFIQTLDRIGEGDYNFEPVFRRDGALLIGDFISVEPNYEEPLYQAAPYSVAEHSDRLVGRIRIGSPMINALIAESSESASGSYSRPTYGDEPPASDGGTGGGNVPPRPGGGSPPATISTEAATDEIADQPQGKSGRDVPAEGDNETRAETGAVSYVEGEDSEETASATEGAVEHVLSQRFAISQSDILRLADELDQVFGRYQLPVQSFRPSLAQAGPNVIRFRTRMLERGTIGSIEARARDIQRELAAEDPVYIGQEPPFVVVDIPRSERSTVTFDDVLPVLGASVPEPGVLPVVMGVNAAGRIIIEDLAQMPHLLVAGTTGSGKSVFLSTIGACVGLLPPSRLELVVVDIKGIDLMALAELPHTRAVIEDPELAIAELKTIITEEVRRRRDIFRRSGARHITEHLLRSSDEDWLKQIVVMIDEYAQLVSAAGRGRSALEQLVQEYAQFARAFGIYLVLATQRPSVDVITGRIKANLPARCVFQVPSFNDSRTVIDTGGAEKLLGAGDMLLYRDGSLQRLQAVYTTLDDLSNVAARHR
jgi:hypothetical protein